MKLLTKLIVVALSALAINSTGLAQIGGTQDPQPPNLRLQGTNNELPLGSVLKLNGTTTISNTSSLPGLLRRITLGTPIVATTNRIVTSVNMKVGAYTIAAQPDVPRNITATITGIGGNDTSGTLIVVGTDINNAALTETITLSAGSGGTGAKAFKTVTSVTGAGWVINSTNDTIVVGVGNLIGLPVILTTATGTALTSLSTTIANSNTTGDASATPAIALSTVDASTGTYDGAKILKVYVDR